MVNVVLRASAKVHHLIPRSDYGHVVEAWDSMVSTDAKRRM